MSLLAFSDWTPHPRARAKLRADVPRCLESRESPPRLRDVAGDVYRCLAVDEGHSLGVALMTASTGRFGWPGTDAYSEDTTSVWVVGERTLFALDRQGFPVDRARSVRVVRTSGVTDVVPVRHTWAGTLYLDERCAPLAPDDVAVSVQHVPGPPEIYWTRDEPGRRRTGNSSREGVRTFLPGGFVQKLGPAVAGAKYPLPNQAPAWASPHLAGDPQHPSAPAFFRIGDAPGDAARPVIASTVDDGVAEVLVRGAEVLVLRDLGSHTLWHWTWDLGVGGSVVVGDDPIHLAPIPERWETPLLRVGEGRLLRVQRLPDDKQAAAAVPKLLPGEVAVSMSSGLVLFAQLDLPRVRGRTLRYLGAALGLTTMRKPLPLVDERPTAIRAPRGSSITPDHRGFSGWYDLPDGSGRDPVDDGKVLVGIRRSGSDGVGKAYVVFAGGVAAEVKDVDHDRDLPAQADAGTAVYSRESNRLVLDRPLAAGAPMPLYLQATFALARQGVPGAFLATARKGPFEVRGTETLWVRTPAGVFSWSASAMSPGWYAAGDLAGHVGKALGAEVHVWADRGTLVLEDPKGISVEVLPGPPGGPFDFSGCQALGLGPGWRRDAVIGYDWVVDPGLAAGSDKSPLPTDTDSGGDRILADPLQGFPALSLPAAPWDDDARLVTGDAVQVVPDGSAPVQRVRVGTDAVIDSDTSTLSWVAPSEGDPVLGPVVPDDGAVFQGRRVEVLDPGADAWRESAVGEVVQAGGSLRLAQSFPPLVWTGTADVHEGVFDAPAMLDGVDLVEVATQGGSGWVAAACEGTRGELALPITGRAGLRAYGVGGWAMIGTLSPLALRADEDIEAVLWTPSGGTHTKTPLVRGVDYTIDTTTGRFGLVKPVAAGTRLQATYFRANPRGQRVGVQETDFAGFLIDKVVAREVDGGYFAFGAAAGQPPVNLERAVTVLARDPQGVVLPSRAPVSYPSDRPGTALIRAAVPAGSSFQVSYWSIDALGGEVTADLPRSPVYLPWLRVPANAAFITLRGDRRDQFASGMLLRVGAECFWVGSVTYSPAPDDLTSVAVTPPSEADAGASRPGGDTLFLVSDRPLHDSRWEWITVQVVDGAIKGSGTVRVSCPSGFQPVAGSVVEIGGAPSAVGGVKATPDGLYDLSLTAPLRAQAAGSKTARMLRAPLGITGMTVAPGVGSVAAGPGTLRVVSFLDPGAPGQPSDDQVNDDTGVIQLTDPLRAGQKLVVEGQRLRPADGAQVRVVGLRRRQPAPGGALRGRYLSSGRDWFAATLLSAAAPLMPLSIAAPRREVELRDAQLRALLHGATLVGHALGGIVEEATGRRLDLLSFLQESDAGLPTPGCLDEVTGRMCPRVLDSSDLPHGLVNDLDDRVRPPWGGPAEPLWRGREGSRVARGRVRWSAEVRTAPSPPGWIPSRSATVAVLRPDRPVVGVEPPRVLRVTSAGFPVEVDSTGRAYVEVSGSTPAGRLALAGQPAWLRSGDLLTPVVSYGGQPICWDARMEASEQDNLYDVQGKPTPLGEAWAAGFPLRYHAERGRVELLMAPLFVVGEADGIAVRPDGRVEVLGGSRAAMWLRTGVLLEGETEGGTEVEAGLMRGSELLGESTPRLLRALCEPAPPSGPAASTSPRIVLDFPRVLSAQDTEVVVSRSALQWDERDGQGFVLVSVRDALEDGRGGWQFTYASADPRGEVVVLSGVTGLRRIDGAAARIEDLPEGAVATGTGSWGVTSPSGGGVTELTIRCPWPHRPVSVDDPDQVVSEEDAQGVRLRVHLTDAQWRVLYSYNRSTTVALYRCFLPGVSLHATWGPRGTVQTNVRPHLLSRLTDRLFERIVEVDDAEPAAGGLVLLRVRPPAGSVEDADGVAVPSPHVARGNWVEVGGWTACVVRVGALSDTPLRLWVRPFGPPDVFLLAQGRYLRVHRDRAAARGAAVAGAVQALEGPLGGVVPSAQDVVQLLRDDQASSRAATLQAASALRSDQEDQEPLVARALWLEGSADEALRHLDALGTVVSGWVRERMALLGRLAMEEV